MGGPNQLRRQVHYRGSDAVGVQGDFRRLLGRLGLDVDAGFGVSGRHLASTELLGTALDGGAAAGISRNRGSTGAGGPVELRVVEEGADRAGGELDVLLDVVGAELQRPVPGGQGMLRELRRGAAVGDDEGLRPGKGGSRHVSGLRLRAPRGGSDQDGGEEARGVRGRYGNATVHPNLPVAMSLVGFHRFLIASGILFCLGFATWEAVRFRAGGGLGSLGLGLLFGVLGLGLLYYLVNLRRFLGTDE